MAQHNEVGKAGEAAAVAYLKAKGYRIRNVNWRKAFLELDIVAQTPDEQVFVEVKTRRGDTSSPAEAMHDTKIGRLVEAADSYIRQTEAEDLPARFDVVFIVGEESDFEIEHIENAFYPPVNTRYGSLYA
jgi:putative endonuclease